MSKNLSIIKEAIKAKSDDGSSLSEHHRHRLEHKIRVARSALAELHSHMEKMNHHGTWDSGSGDVNHHMEVVGQTMSHLFNLQKV